MPRKRSIHGTSSPYIITVSLTAGIAFALGHHFFYNNLHGAPVSSGEYDLGIGSVSPQQLNVAGGTALSFLCKACLVVAISTTYVQLFWRNVAHCKDGNTLQTLDTWYSALDDLSFVGKPWAWWRNPLLSLVAAVVWLLPLAAVITPATLSVASAPRAPAPSSLQQVPHVNFASLNYAREMPGRVLGPTDTGQFHYQYGYYGPSRATSNLVRSVAANGELPQLTPPGPNSTWELEFPGPALQCREPSAGYRSEIERSILDASAQFRGGDGLQASNKSSDLIAPYRYLAWNADGSILDDRPSRPLPFTDEGDVNGDTSGMESSLPRSMLLNLAIMPGFLYADVNASNNSPRKSPEDVFANATFLQCNVVNATYHTHFNFADGIQAVDIQTEVTSEELVKTVISVNGPAPPDVLSATNSTDFDCTALHGSDQRVPTCEFDVTVLQRISYQALMQSFSKLFIGYMWGSDYYTKTSLGQTVIWDHPVIKPVQTDLTFSLGENTNWSLQEAVAGAAPEIFRGLATNSTMEMDDTLGNAIERLFEKIVVSAMNVEDFQPQADSAFAPPPTNVTFNTYHNVYVYSVAKLWIAYGIAIVAAAAMSLLGLFVIFASEESYGQRFSSVFLFAHGAAIQPAVHEAHASAEDSVPEYVKKAVVVSKGSLKGEEKTYSRKAQQARSTSAYELIDRAPPQTG